ncbi:MAG: hypothetical protein IKG40_00530 [Bacilli bacterium]|nr:hypothetical protein [Bacilli bacterium]
MLILILKEILLKETTRKELLLLFISFILLSLLLLHVNGIAMLPLFFFIYSARNIEFKKIAKFTTILSFILLIFIIISAELGIITNYQTITEERTRTYLGFRYPLFPQMILFNITLANLYANKENFSLIRSLFWIIINYWMFTYTDSRLSCYLAILLVFAVAFIQKKPNFFDNKKLLSYILIFSFPICAILSIGVTSSYDISSSTMYNLDEFLGGRLHLGYNSLSEYEINLFGHDTKYIGAGLNIDGQRTVGIYNYVDCLYINMLEKYGLIFNILFLSLLSYVLYKIWQKKDYILFIILIGFAFHGIIDDLEIYLYYNIFWLAIAQPFITKDNNEKIETKS